MCLWKPLYLFFYWHLFTIAMELNFAAICRSLLVGISEDGSPIENDFFFLIKCISSSVYRQT